jgi:hypothetical protein
MNGMLPKRGDAFTIGLNDGFGVILSVNPVRGICFVHLQNGTRGEIGVAVAAKLVAELRARAGNA